MFMHVCVRVECLLSEMLGTREFGISDFLKILEYLHLHNENLRNGIQVQTQNLFLFLT